MRKIPPAAHEATPGGVSGGSDHPPSRGRPKPLLQLREQARQGEPESHDAIIWGMQMALPNYDASVFLVEILYEGLYACSSGWKVP